MNYRDQACEVEKPSSATNMVLNEMESAITILGEAIDRLALCPRWGISDERKKSIRGRKRKSQ
jgi:hypothetical protein